MTDLYEDGAWLDWRGQRSGYGDGSRWLINKHASGRGWLLHEPITDTSCGAIVLPTFRAAVEAFKVFSRRDAS
jgi:hypothetical protein